MHWLSGKFLYCFSSTALEFLPFNNLTWGEVVGKFVQYNAAQFEFYGSLVPLGICSLS